MSLKIYDKFPVNPFNDYNLLSHFTQVACRANILIVCGSVSSAHEKESSLVHYGSHNDFLAGLNGV